MIRSPSFSAWSRPLLAAVLSLAIAALTGCVRHEATPASAADTHPVQGGELVFAFDGAAGSSFAFDPELSGFAPHHRVMRSIYDSLVVLLPEHRVGPWLATSWEQSPDGLSWLFHLRHDVTFHDGTRFDAAAVKFNLDRLTDPHVTVYALGDLAAYERSDVVDDFTVRIHLKKPFAPLLVNLSKTSLGMVSPAAVKARGDQFALHPVGTGPFRFVSMAQGTEVLLERNPDYRWAPEGAANPGPAYLQRLVFKNVPEEATRVAVLSNGQAGAADIIPAQNLIALRKDPAYRVLESEFLNLNFSLYLNLERDPWKDERARRAFRLSLDMDAAVRTVNLGTVARAWTPLSPSILGYGKVFENSWKPDHAQAVRLLDELGWKPGVDGIRVKDGKRLTVVLIDSQGNREKRLDLLTVLRRQLADSGIELRIENVAGGNYLQRLLSHDFDLVGGSLFSADPDVLRRIFSPEERSRASYTSVNDAQLQRLLDAGEAESDLARRTAIYVAAQKIILDQTYAIPTYVLNYVVATRTDVQGVTIDRLGFPNLQGAWVRP